MIPRAYKTLRALWDGETIEFEGLKLKADSNQAFSPGDVYIAERNTGPELLTVKSVNTVTRSISSKEGAYPYDIRECVKVKLVEKSECFE